MKYRVGVTGFILVVAFGLLYQLLIEAESDSSLILGVFPRHPSALTMEMYAPMAAYLTRELHRRVLLETTDDFASFWEQVRAKRYHIVHYNQYHYIRSHAALDYRVLVMNEEDGKATISAGIIVRKDANIKSVQDLRGKKVLFGGDRTAMLSYIYCTYLLRQAGLEEGDYEWRFERDPPTAIVATYHGLWDASAAAASDVALNLPMVRQRAHVEDLTYLVTGEQYAQLPWAVRGDLPSEMQRAIGAAMLGLNTAKDGKKVLAKAKLTGVKQASDGDYTPYRHMVKEVLGEEY